MDSNSNGEETTQVRKAKNKRKRLSGAVDDSHKRGVCYLSRIPPGMKPSHVRQMLSKYGELQRVYLPTDDPSAQVNHKKGGGFRGKWFTEGWVEFSKKSVAKRVAKMLNNQQIGGRKRNPFYYDIWNIKYLSKFKWDDLNSEIAVKSREREQKMTMEISAAKRERDFYLSKVEQKRALLHIQDRRKKKRELEGEESKEEPQKKIMRKIPQKKPVGNGNNENKPKLSKDFLRGVFGGP
ncbi:hypothetical protein LUZ60_014006 [Juncus effusus]|nr:hypothetical protein LUZ60_014006 [Juncus effusus]